VVSISLFSTSLRMQTTELGSNLELRGLGIPVYDEKRELSMVEALVLRNEAILII
jgi:hypothetical protein